MSQSPEPAPKQSSGPNFETFAALKERDFLWLWLGLLSSFFSLQTQNLARGYLAYQITGSAAALGLVLAAWGIPMISLGLVAGVVADRVPKKYVLYATQSTLGVSALLTALLLTFNVIEIWHLVVLGFIQVCAFAFNVPTRQAIIPEVVPREKLPNAIALISAGSNLANISAPPLAGALIAIPWFGVGGAFYLGAALYLIVLTMLFNLPAHVRRSGKRSFVADLRAGLGYVRRHRVLPLYLLMMLVPWTLVLPYQQSLPAFAAEAMAIGPGLLGILMGALGLGSLSGSVIIATFASSPNRNRIQIFAGIIFAILLIAFSITTDYWAAVAIMFGVGIAQNMFTSLNQTGIMQNTEPEYYGRVVSITSLISSLGPLAVLPFGLMMDTIGPRQTVGGGAAIVLAFFVGVAVLRPEMRQPVRRD